MPDIEVKAGKFDTMVELVKEGGEALVFMGCGEPLSDWVKGANDFLKEQNVFNTADDKLTDWWTWETTGGRVDLAAVLTGTSANIGLLAIVRLMLPACSWASDYIVNYRHHNVSELPLVNVYGDEDGDNEEDLPCFEGNPAGELDEGMEVRDDVEDVKYPEVEVVLSGEDGNAYSIMGKVRLALRHARVSAEEIETFTKECMESDYDNLLATCMRWVMVY